MGSSSVLGSGCTPMLVGVAHPLVSVYCLGVLLDLLFLLDAQVVAMVRDTYNQMNPFLDKKHLSMVIYALVTSRLGCCNVLYIELSLKTSQKLQLIQRAVARMLTGMNRFQHVTLLQELHWLPVVFCAWSMVLVISFKGL